MRVIRVIFFISVWVGVAVGYNTEAAAQGLSYFTHEQVNKTMVSPAHVRQKTGFGNSGVSGPVVPDGAQPAECDVNDPSCRPAVSAGQLERPESYESANLSVVNNANLDAETIQLLPETESAKLRETLSFISGSGSQALDSTQTNALLAAMLRNQQNKSNREISNGALADQARIAWLKQCIPEKMQQMNLTRENAENICLELQSPHDLATQPTTASSGGNGIQPENMDINAVNSGFDGESDQLCLSDLAFAEETSFSNNASHNNDPDQQRAAEVRRQVREDFLAVCGDICYRYDNTQADRGLLNATFIPIPPEFEGDYGKGIGGIVHQFTKEAYDNILDLLFKRCECHNEGANISVKNWDPFDPTMAICSDSGVSGSGINNNNLTLWGRSDLADEISRASFGEWSFIGTGECLWKEYTITADANPGSAAASPIGGSLPTTSGGDTFKCEPLDPLNGEYTYDKVFAPSTSGTGTSTGSGTPSSTTTAPPFFQQLHFIATGLAYQRLFNTQAEVVSYAQKFSAMDNEQLVEAARNQCDAYITPQNRERWEGKDGLGGGYKHRVDLFLENLKMRCDVGQSGGSPVTATSGQGTTVLSPNGG
jgi:hypothetical protein